ncbi:MAG: hypothetical protein KKG26_07585 [Firmicutes bacterium]|nr:hypothetical protein [Bacillota bacterium]MBV1735902.1 hypothetical protein [Desulforudis sp.]MDZ7610092.1 hypothetical protein [Eubacteriales bacterium]
MGNPIAFQIRQPDAGIDFEGEQLEVARRTLKHLTPNQVLIAKYWGTGPPTKQWTPIIDILIDTYGINAPRAARILGAALAEECTVSRLYAGVHFPIDNEEGLRLGRQLERLYFFLI